MSRSMYPRLVLLVVLCAPVLQPLHAQGMLDRIKQKAKDRLQQRTDQLADSATTVALDRIEGAIRCVVTDKTCISNARDAGKPVIVTNDAGTPLANQPYAQPATTTAPAAPAGAAQPATSEGAASGGTAGTGLWVNYDFVPGDTVIFAEDFADDPVGDFPKRLQLVSGNYEVARVDGLPFLRGTAPGKVLIQLPRVLPQRFTLEADIRVSPGGYVKFWFVDPDKDAKAGYVQFNPSESGVTGPGFESISSPAEDVNNAVFHARLMVDGQHVKVYVNDKRVANAPSAYLGRSNQILVGLPGDENNPVLLTNVRIAAGGKSLYEALVATGRATTHGLLFDTGSDRIRGESTPTLKEIGAMLQQHPELKLTIEGHTDNVGDAAANQTLSEQRATAVVQYLVQKFGIDAGRLTSKGYGATRPVAPNTTPEGRQMNRRVDLVKS